MGVLQATQAKVFNVTKQFVSFHHKKWVFEDEKTQQIKMEMLQAAGIPHFLLTMYHFPTTFLVPFPKNR